MCACRVEEMQQTQTAGPSTNRLSQYTDLEDYLFEKQRTSTGDSEHDDGDIYAQLAQKEKDLILAAELGKALLERNEELSRANEIITEEYTQKLELLEQEKHGLRRKLDSISGEYDGRVSELQVDITQLRRELGEHRSFSKTTEKEKSQLVKELHEQNHRLTLQLKQSSKREEQQASQMQSLREQFHARRLNLSDQVLQLDGLREEIELLSEKKADLERRIQVLTEERQNLSLSLEESSDRILMLEKHTKEQEQQLRGHRRDLDELREENSTLQDKLDSLRMRSSTPSYGQTSLYNEIEMSSQSSIDEEIRSLSGSQNCRSRPHSHPGSSIGFHGDLDDIECEELDLDENWKFRQDIVELYQQLIRLSTDLRRRRENISEDSGVVPGSPEEVQAQQLRISMLTDVIKDIRGLMQDLQNDSPAFAPCVACQNIMDVKDQAKKLSTQLEEKGQDLQKKHDEIADLTTKLSVREQELCALREERDQLRQDLNSSKMAKDEIVKKAWEGRDQAVARKNATEIELAKTRIDIMHVNSQLMEAIQQKIELSQQLEQWQVDMQHLLDEQVKKKLRTQELEDRKRAKSQRQRQNATSGGSNGPTSKSKLFGLWRT